MKVYKKIIVAFALIICSVTLTAGMITAYENMRQFAFDDTKPAIYVYTNKNNDKVLKFFDSKVNLSQLSASAAVSMRGITDYLSKNLDTLVDKFKKINEYIKISLGSLLSVT